LTDQWKESIIVTIYKRAIKLTIVIIIIVILSNILLSRLSLCAEEIIGDHQCGFRRNRSTTDQIFCVRQILVKKWEYNETVYLLFIDFKGAYASVRREVLYNNLTEFVVPMKLVRQNKVCLNETYSQVRIGLNQGDALSPLL
jgi:hypothetical protein